MNTYQIPRNGMTNEAYAAYAAALPWTFATGASVSFHINFAAEQVSADGVVPGFVQVPSVLDANKLSAWKRIKAKRERVLAGGVKFIIGAVDYWFHTDVDSRADYETLLGKAMRDSWPDATVIHPEWKTMSGAKVPMTVLQLKQIVDAGISAKLTIFAVGESHKAQMESSVDPLAYDFSASWPKVYGE